MRELVLALIVVASIPFILKRPWLGVVAYMGINIIRPEMFFQGGGQGNYVFKVYYALVIITALIGGHLYKVRHAINRQSLVMVWFLAGVWVSIVFMQYPAWRPDFYALELTKTVVLCALISMMVDKLEDLLKIQNVLLVCFALLAIWGIEQSLRGNERLEGLSGADSNGIAALYVMFIPVALAKLYTSVTRKQKVISAGIVALMVILVVLTQSRGGLLGLIVAVAAFGWYIRNLRKIALVGALGAVLVLSFAGKAYVDRMKTMEAVTGTQTLESSARSRLILWQLGLMIFADNPLYGTGFFTYPSAKLEYQDKFSDLEGEFKAQIFRDYQRKVTHNSYIQMLADCGLFGAIPFILLIAGGVLSGFRARRLLIRFPEKSAELKWLCGLCAGMSGFAVCIFFLDAVTEVFIYFQLTFIWIMLRLLTEEGIAGQAASPVSLQPEGNSL